MTARISADPELRTFAKRLMAARLDVLRQLAVQLCEHGAKLVSLEEPVASAVLDRLRLEEPVSRELADTLQQRQAAVDDEYLELLNAKKKGQTISSASNDLAKRGSSPR